MGYAGQTLSWDPLEYEREQLVIEADMHCEVMELSKRIDEIERRELHKAVNLWRSFVQLQAQAEARRAPQWTQRAILKALDKCEAQIRALGGEPPVDL